MSGIHQRWRNTWVWCDDVSFRTLRWMHFFMDIAWFQIVFLCYLCASSWCGFWRVEVLGLWRDQELLQRLHWGSDCLSDGQVWHFMQLAQVMRWVDIVISCVTHRCKRLLLGISVPRREAAPRRYLAHNRAAKPSFQRRLGVVLDRLIPWQSRHACEGNISLLHCSLSEVCGNIDLFE